MDCFGGRRGGDADFAPDYVQATIETNLCGRLIIALTSKPSKAEAFKALGCRIYVRGVAKAQQELDEVRSWMTRMMLLTRV